MFNIKCCAYYCRKLHLVPHVVFIWDLRDTESRRIINDKPSGFPWEPLTQERDACLATHGNAESNQSRL